MTATPQPLDTLPAEPWRNGRGVTRTVARADDAHGTLWRLSVADVDASGAFSHFSGLARTAVLGAGGPLVLHVAGRPHRLVAVGDRACFGGDEAASATLAGAPARLWNVMTRRGSASAQVTLCGADPAPWALVATADTAHALWVLAGHPRWGTGAPQARLHAGELLVLREPGTRVVVQSEGGTALLHTVIRYKAATGSAC